MNNLTPYESYLLNESVDINGPMGFVLSFNLSSSNGDTMNYTGAGIYDTFYDFAQIVNGDLAFVDDTTEFKNIEDLMDRAFDSMEGGNGDYEFWHGFRIKPGADGYNSESNLNCYRVQEMLDKLFVNPKNIMMRESNNRFNHSYLARSVEKDPEKLLMYEDDPEMYEEIVRLLNWDKRKLDAILKVNRIKNQF